MRHAARAVAAVIAGLVLAGAAGAAGMPPIVESQPVGSQASPATSGQGPASAGPAPQRVQSLDERVTRIERQLESQALVDMYSRLDSLQQQVQELRGIVEEQTHGMEGVEQRQREVYLDFDRRIRQLETELAGLQQAQEQALSRPAEGGSADALSAAGASPEQQAEQAAYQQAFDVLKAGRYDDSITAFQKFLARYPEGQHSANAQYWLGEANYVMKRYPEAIGEFEKVVKGYPDSGKVPDAMLKLGYSQYEAGQRDQAVATLSAIAEKYPKTAAAQLAQNRLQRIKAGH